MGTHAKGAVGKNLRRLFTLYMLLAITIFAPYFNWRYAQENGFLKWVMFGEIVPTLKAVAWPYFLVADRNASTEAAERRANEARYRQEVSAATEELAGLETEQTILAGKVQERGEREGKEAALDLLAVGMEQIVDRQQVIVLKLEGIKVPARYQEFHRLLVERHSKQSGWMHQMVGALRVNDDTLLQKLRSEEAAFEEQWKQRIVKVAQDAGLAAP